MEQRSNEEENNTFEVQSSVELKQTSKGTNYTVKVYDRDPARAFRVANELFEQCRRKYPEVTS
jgi:hypothetical protein